MSLWLSSLGAKVTGYALKPPTKPSLFKLCQIDDLIDKSIIADVRDAKKLTQAILKAKPEIVIHMAAQPIVRESYKVPVDTYAINVIGTVNLLEAVRSCPSVKAVVNVTTDKVYENRVKGQGSRVIGFKEDNPLGGYDPYSSSKACSELVSAAYRNSYDLPIATARAGNVIGGGDWADDRLVPDFIRSILKGKELFIRNPKATRPWQHVLEPLAGYLLLAEKLYKNKKFARAYNFGPKDSDAKPVGWLVEKLCSKWGKGAAYKIDKKKHPHEAHFLQLNWAKAKTELDWQPKWDLDKTLDKIVEWTQAYNDKDDLRQICWDQIKGYESDNQIR